MAIDISKDFHVTRASAIATWNGNRDIIEITTDKGRIIRRTLNHPLWCDLTPYRYESRSGTTRLRPQGEWVWAGGVTIGSTLAVYLGNDGPRKSNHSLEEIKIAAYLLADGGLTGCSVIWTKSNPVLIEEFKTACAHLGSIVTTAPDGIQHRACRNSGGNPIKQLATEWGLMGCRSSEKHFPSFVWNLDTQSLALFLNRLFAGDGWAHWAPRPERAQHNREVGYCSTSEQLVRDISKALLRLGIQSEIRKKKTVCIGALGKKVHGEAWSVCIHDCENICLFSDRVGILGKEVALGALAENCASASRKEQQKWRHYGLPDHVQWERVKSVRVIAEQPTVSISVPGYETFLTEFIEHNSASCSIAILWFALTREALRLDWKLPVTASVQNQLKNYLWPEVKKWSRRLNWDKIGRPAFNLKSELLTMELHLVLGQAFCVSPEEPGKLEGAHADHLFFCYDEAKLIEEGIWDAAEGAFAGSGPDTGMYAFALAISTPGEPSGRFYQIHQRAKGLESWYPVHVTCEDAIKAGRISRDWVEQMKLQWGETSALFKSKVLGEFASADVDSVIPLDWVEMAADRYERRMAQLSG